MDSNGAIDFSNPQSPGGFILQAEDTRIVDSIGGVERREIRWRKATLDEAKAVVVAYYARRNLTMAANFVVKIIEHWRTASGSAERSPKARHAPWFGKIRFVLWSKAYSCHSMVGSRTW